MKYTGIVRCIDDLGRVVIPKEIRRTMKIDTGDPLKIYINPYEGKVVFKKYYLCSCSSEQESIIKFAEWIKTDYKPYLYCKCSLEGSLR